jgi:hypothetical protein
VAQVEFGSAQDHDELSHQQAEDTSAVGLLNKTQHTSLHMSDERNFGVPTAKTKPSKKKTKRSAAKKPAPVVLNVDVSKKRKKRPPRTAYSKENPSPHAFKPGESGNPGGKAHHADALLSKSLRVALADRAPAEVTQGFNLPSTASWSQVIARKLLILAIRGDLQAVAEIRALTEVAKVHASLDVNDPGAAPPLIEICFVESNGDGRPAAGLIIDAKPGSVSPALPGAATD